MCAVPKPWDLETNVQSVGHLVKPVDRSDLKAVLQSLKTPIKQILIVDDDPDVLHLFHQMMISFDPDLEVQTISNGYQALEYLHNTTPDLLLLASDLPGIDGWKIIETLQENEEVSIPPTVFISEYDPADQILASTYLFVALDKGFPINKLLTMSSKTQSFHYLFTNDLVEGLDKF